MNYERTQQKTARLKKGGGASACASGYQPGHVFFRDGGNIPKKADTSQVSFYLNTPEFFIL